MSTADERLERKRERNREYMRRKRAHRNQYNSYWPIDQLVIEIELLKGTDDPRSIAHRLGYDKPASLHKRLMNHGYKKLARMFDNLEEDQSAA